MSRINHRRRASWKFRKPLIGKAGHVITPDDMYVRGREKTKFMREAHHETSEEQDKDSRPA